MKITKQQLQKIITEAVVSHLVKEEAPKTPVGSFKVGQFRKLKTLRERLQYLNTRSDVEEISSGSSRIAFYINNKKQVIKVAKWQRGKAQNKTEYQATNCGNPKYLPKMFAKAGDYSWIIVESVIPLKNARQFEYYTGFPIRALEVGINYLGPEMQRRPAHDKTKRKYKAIHEAMAKRSPWYRGLVNMAINCNFVAGDIGKWDSWGITKRGRVVLVDYGLTEDVWNTYYARTA